jgi:hypothetical protein
MAVLLHHPPAGGAHAVAAVVAVLKRDIAATLNQQQAARPVLCHRQQDAEGRLYCHWEIEPAASIPINPNW